MKLQPPSFLMPALFAAILASPSWADPIVHTQLIGAGGVTIDVSVEEISDPSTQGADFHWTIRASGGELVSFFFNLAEPESVYAFRDFDPDSWSLTQRVVSNATTFMFRTDGDPTSDLSFYMTYTGTAAIDEIFGTARYFQTDAGFGQLRANVSGTALRGSCGANATDSCGSTSLAFGNYFPSGDRLNQVPEPVTLALFGAALAAVGVARRRKLA